MPGGRPSKYKPEYASQVTKLAHLGATDTEIADFFAVNVDTVHRWKHVHKEFSDALKVGKSVADDRVERSLYMKAVGYTFDSEKIFNANGAALRVPVREHVPPDAVSCIFWLKNRRGEEWREKVVNEHTGKDGESLFKDVVVTIVDPAKPRQL